MLYTLRFLSTPAVQGAQNLSTPTDSVFKLCQRHIIFQCSYSVGVDAYWAPIQLLLTHHENQIGWHWRIMRTKSVGVDAFWTAWEKLVEALYLWRGTENDNFNFTPMISKSEGYMYQKICFRDRVPLISILHVDVMHLYKKEKLFRCAINLIL